MLQVDSLFTAWFWFLAVLLGCAALWWAVNTLYSLVLSSCLFCCRFNGAARLAGHSSYGPAQFKALPVVWAPLLFFSRGNSRVGSAEMADPVAVLLHYESLLTASAPREMYFVRFPERAGAAERLCSVVVVYPLALLSVGLAWIQLEHRGPFVEWTIYCAEIRSWRTPTESGSHFSSPRGSEFIVPTPQDDGFQHTWKIISLDQTCEAGAARADYLERFVKDIWSTALQPLRSPRPMQPPVGVPAGVPGTSRGQRPSPQSAPHGSGAASPRRPRRPPFTSS